MAPIKIQKKKKRDTKKSVCATGTTYLLCSRLHMCPSICFSMWIYDAYFLSGIVRYNDTNTYTTYINIQFVSDQIASNANDFVKMCNISAEQNINNNNYYFANRVNEKEIIILPLSHDKIHNISS